MADVEAGVMLRGPLAGRYPVIAAMVMFALIPYLAISAALGPLTPIIAGSLHMSRQTMSLSSGLANAAYAVGTILAVQLSQLVRQGRLLLGCLVLLVAAAVVTAAAQYPGMYIAGLTAQALCTSLLLVAAVPPLTTGFSADRLRDTAVILSICIFGAVALGPLIGGAQAEAHAWRPLFWVAAGIAAAALVLHVLTFQDTPPEDPDASRTPLPSLLACVGCVAAFIGAAELTTHAFTNPIVVTPLFGGLATIVLLLVYQYRAQRPLLTIKRMFNSSISVAALIIALFAAAASVSVTSLTVTLLAGRYSPIHVGLLYVPEVVGAALATLALGRLMRRRELQYLPLFGMVTLAAGIAVFVIQEPSSQAQTLLGSLLTGIGLGATVAPSLFIAGMSLPATDLQRVVAVIELMRAVAAFLIVPIFAHLALTVSGNLQQGTSVGLWIGLGLAVTGTVTGAGVYILSGARPQTPDIEQFVDGTSAAWYSPPLLSRARTPAN